MVGPLEQLSATAELPQARMHAMYALAGLKSLSPKVVLARLADDHPRVREHAVRLSEPLAQELPELRAKLYTLADDPDLRVRYQLAFTLGEFDDAGRYTALAAIARHDAADRWVRLAILSSLAQGGGQLFATLAADPAFRASPAGRDFLGDLARYLGRQNHRNELTQLLTALDTIPPAESGLAEAVVRGLGEGLSKGPGTLEKELAAIGGERATKTLSRMLATARERAPDDTLSPADRVDAIRLLSLGTFTDAGPVLIPLVSNVQPQVVQSAALNTLGKFADPSIAVALVTAWPSLSPRLRAEAAEVIFSRSAWLAALVTAAEQEKLSLTDLDPARLKTLENHPDAALRQRAAPLVAKLKLGRRQDVVEAYRPALTAQGDRSRGRQVFQKVCAACHRLEGVGHEIGPNLASFRNRGAEAILTNVLDPNREVNPQYVNYVLITNDGRAMTGLIASETATSVTLRRAEDITDTVARGDIEELRSSGLSIMPEGMEKQIDPAAMADLLAYLLSTL